VVDPSFEMQAKVAPVQECQPTQSIINTLLTTVGTGAELSEADGGCRRSGTLSKMRNRWNQSYR